MHETVHGSRPGMLCCLLLNFALQPIVHWGLVRSKTQTCLQTMEVALTVSFRELNTGVHSLLISNILVDPETSWKTGHSKVHWRWQMHLQMEGTNMRSLEDMRRCIFNFIEPQLRSRSLCTSCRSLHFFEVLTTHFLHCERSINMDVGKLKASFVKAAEILERWLTLQVSKALGLTRASDFDTHMLCRD